MTISNVAAPTVYVSNDVYSLAEEQGVKEYVEPIVEMAKTLYPDPVVMRVYVTIDHEAEDDMRILVELKSHIEIGPYREAHRRWFEELRRICSAPGACVFRLGIFEAD